MISDARGGHVSPGIYTEERDVKYTVNSLGITSLGLVGETLKGPAFQNIPIKSWGEFVDYFGGTSTEKYKANGRPKYELPYVAKEYLKESKRLNVVRVLGLSGYDAGPAWTLQDNEGNIVLVLRSRMSFDVPSNEASPCQPGEDKPEAVTTKIEKVPYKTQSYTPECAAVTSGSVVDGKATHMGIQVTYKQGNETDKTATYYVSLDSSDYDYIYNVLPMSPNDDFPIYVESVFENKVSEDMKLATGFTPNAVAYDYYENQCTYSYEEFIPSQDEQDSAEVVDKVPETVNENSQKFIKVAEQDGKFKFYRKIASYKYEKNDNLTEENKKDAKEVNEVPKTVDKNSEEFIKIGDYYYTSFEEAFRYAQTPWIVSNISANVEETTGTTATTTLSMKKLFRFMTISDGNSADEV